MLKKLASLLLSLLICVSLLPGQAYAAKGPDPVDPPIHVEPLDPEGPGEPGDPDDPEPPVMPMGQVPEGEDEFYCDD